MIPKIIHYCWFGPNSISKEAEMYIETWKKYCPDYELVCWSENRFDINSNVYVKEAYENKKYAFVTDYVRLYALYHFGGIYMDTDVEVCKKLDSLLKYPAFSGYESESKIPTGTMAAEKHNKWIGLLLKDYDNIHFVRKNGTLDLTTNTERITQTTVKNYNVCLNGKKLITDDFVMFPFEYLCAKEWESGCIRRTEDTFTIHHFAKTWQSGKVKLYGKVRRAIKYSRNPVFKVVDKMLDSIVRIMKKN